MSPRAPAVSPIRARSRTEQERRPVSAQPAGDVRGEPLGERGHRERCRRETRGILLELLDVLARGMLERLREQVVARGEVVGRRRQRHAGLARDRPMRHGSGSFAADEGERGVENTPTLRLASLAADRRGRSAQWPPARLRPITPAMISAMQPSRSALTGSPSAIMPISAIAAVPMPAQTA